MVRDGYKNTEVGVIPVDWEVVTVNDVADVLTGYPFPSSKYSKSGTKLLRGSNVKRNTLDWSTRITKYWAEITPDIQHYILEDGDIVIAMDGSLVGRSFAQVTKTDLPLLLLQRVARLRSLKVDVGYLKELICCPIFTKHCDEVKTVTAIPHISPADIKGYQIPFPPTPAEQVAIATALSDTDALLSSLDALIGKKEAFKRGMMEGLLSGERRLEGFGREWKRQTLADVAEFLDGKRVPIKAEDRLRMKGTIPYYGASGIIDYVNDFIFDEDLILLGEDGENIISRNQPLAFRISGKTWVNNHAHVIRPNKNIEINWLCAFLESLDYTDLNSGTAQPKLNRKNCDSIEVITPPLPEQRAIATVLSDLDAELSGLRARRAKLGLVKEGMMEVLLSGAVRLV